METEMEMLRREMCAGFARVNVRIDQLHRETTKRIDDCRRDTDLRIEASRRETQKRIDGMRKETDPLAASSTIRELRREIIERIEAVNERIDRLLMR